MTFGEALVNAVRSHTGLHYVPSFNDMCTNSNDDAEEMDREAGRRDQDLSAASAPPVVQRKTTNKSDDLPGPTHSLLDVHKIEHPNLGPGSGRADWLYDRPREGRAAPSIWQTILSSQGKSAPAFTDMAPSKEHTIGADDLQKHLRVTPNQAEAMVREADRDRDARISAAEYEDILAEISP